MTKFIVVVGGVLSGVGKGVTTASLARLLQEYGYKVTSMKIDPYINYDAGTLRPTEHGEVWVTDDGGEIDQDLGTYERFLDKDILKKNCMTTGQIYKTIIDKERKGEYLGQTVQFIPHVPNEILRRVKNASKGHDICIIEIGGTIGDYENIPYLFAVKSLQRQVKPEDIITVLITYLPVPGHIEEMKTKPTQQAIRLLSENGLIADFIVCRANKKLDVVRKKKIETYANIVSEHVISAPDVESIYQIPLDLRREDFGLKVLRALDLRAKKNPKMKDWERLVRNIRRPRREITIGVVGKYVDIGDYSLGDSYLSISQSLIHAGAEFNAGIKIRWIDAKKLETGDLSPLKGCKGIIVPGGFGTSGVEGKIAAIRYAREKKVPYLGLCYGMQLAAVEFARNVCGMKGAHTAEVKKSKYTIVDIIPSQKKLMAASDYGGTMRLGAYAAIIDPKSKVYNLYKKLKRTGEDKARLKVLAKDKDQRFRIGILPTSSSVVLERHRHRYEINPEFVSQLEAKGLVFSGHHVRKDKTVLQEFIELPNHPFFMATQSHPEFKSRLGNPAPLFYGFVQAAIK